MALKDKKYLWKSFILTFLAIMFMVNVPVTAPSTVTYSIDPYITTGVTAGGAVSVDITIDIPVNTTGFRIWVKIDPAVLTLGYEILPGITMYVTEGNFLSDWADEANYNWTAGIAPLNYVMDSDGYSDISLFIKTWEALPDGHGANGTGTLVTLWFTSLSKDDYSLIDITKAQYTTPPPEAALVDVDVINDGHYNQPRITHTVTVGGQTYYVVTESNSTVSNFAFNETYSVGNQRGETSFNVTGPAGTTGFSNITIPKNLTTGQPWLILVDGGSVSYSEGGNDTHTWLYFTYTHGASPSTVQIYGTWVVPEFPTFMVLPLLIIATIIAAIISKKVWSTRRRGHIHQIKRNFIQPT